MLLVDIGIIMLRGGVGEGGIIPLLLGGSPASQMFGMNEGLDGSSGLRCSITIKETVG